MRSQLNAVSAIVGCLLLSIFTGCKSGTSGTTVSIANSGGTTTILAGSAAVTLTAAVTHGTNANFTWNLSGAGCGTLVPAGNTATYTPPSENALNANCTATITATSASSTSAKGTIVFTVNAVALTLPSGESPTLTVTAGGAGTALTVAISNDASGSATVNWSLSGAAPASARTANAAVWGAVDQSMHQSSLFRQAADSRGPQPAVTPTTCGSLSATSGDSVTFTPPASGSCTATITASTSINPNVTQVFTVTVNAAVLPTFIIGGTVSGLNSGASVVLLDNGADALTVSSNTSFTFATPIASGSNYHVTIGTEPTGQSCQVANGGPLPVSANITNVTVTCSAVSASSVQAQHALAQTGLAIALASNVLQSQLLVVFTSGTQSSGCTNSTDGTYSYQTGGTPTVTITTATPPIPLYPVTVYYGTNCVQPYIAADITGASLSGSNSTNIIETATYTGPTGTALGTMTLNETLSETGTSPNQFITANGLGIFTPVSGAKTPVQLGLYCTVNLSASSWPCAGGIAQDFPNLNLAIGAVTPLTLVPPTGSTTTLTFSGGGSVVTGPLASLTLTNPSPTSLVVAGGTAYTSTTVTGSAGAFTLIPPTLFPPTPTSWTIIDATHDEKFEISVLSDATRDSSITITQISTGNTLATGTVDKSGTSAGSGNITYSDGSTSAITSWTLAD